VTSDSVGERDRPLLAEVRAGVLRLTLNRPQARNALTPVIFAGLSEWLHRAIDREISVRAIVLAGTGKAFCVGADLSGEAFAQRFDETRHAFMDLLRLARRVEVPIVARLHGDCLAGGMGLLAMADLAVASEDARFGLPEIKVGVMPMMVMALLKELVAPRAMMEMMLTGDTIDAAHAKAIGLLNHVVPPGALDAKVDAITEAMVARSPAAIRRGKYAALAVRGMTFEQASVFLESQFALAAQTRDAQEGIAAFREKRQPVWGGE
jgi:methylglutaconyl-CoA hydratase